LALVCIEQKLALSLMRAPAATPAVHAPVVRGPICVEIMGLCAVAGPAAMIQFTFGANSICYDE